MNNFIKENWLKISLLITIIIIVGAGFYWFQLRPAIIRVDCKKWVSDSKISLTSDAEQQELGLDMNKINEAERIKSDFWYKDCLNSKGLEK